MRKSPGSKSRQGGIRPPWVQQEPPAAQPPKSLPRGQGIYRLASALSDDVGTARPAAAERTRSRFEKETKGLIGVEVRLPLIQELLSSPAAGLRALLSPELGMASTNLTLSARRCSARTRASTLSSAPTRTPRRPGRPLRSLESPLSPPTVQPRPFWPSGASGGSKTRRSPPILGPIPSALRRGGHFPSSPSCLFVVRWRQAAGKVSAPWRRAPTGPPNHKVKQAIRADAGLC